MLREEGAAGEQRLDDPTLEVGPSIGSVVQIGGEQRFPMSGRIIAPPLLSPSPHLRALSIFLFSTDPLTARFLCFSMRTSCSALCTSRLLSVASFLCAAGTHFGASDLKGTKADKSPKPRTEPKKSPPGVPPKKGPPPPHGGEAAIKKNKSARRSKGPSGWGGIAQTCTAMHGAKRALTLRSVLNEYWRLHKTEAGNEFDIKIAQRARGGGEPWLETCAALDSGGL